MEQPQSGPVEHISCDDLNANVIVWQAGGGVPDHVNEDLDVLLAVFEGSMRLDVDGEARELRAGECALVPKGARRGIQAGPDGVRYLGVHARREPLGISSAI